MKKILLFVVLLAFVCFTTACGSSGSKNKATRTVEDLLDLYVKAYTKADSDAAREIFPPFYIKYADEKGIFDKAKLESSLENAKERYGDDFTIVYEITKTTKLTDEELEEVNNMYNQYFGTTDKASECYKYEGTITFKGSTYTDTDPISSMGYCKYDGAWYLVNY